MNDKKILITVDDKTKTFIVDLENMDRAELLGALHALFYQEAKLSLMEHVCPNSNCTDRKYMQLIVNSLAKLDQKILKMVKQ